MIKSLLFAIGLTVASSNPAQATALAKNRERVVIAVDGIEQPRNLPAILAERLGYFRDAGLTVTLVDAAADPSPAKLMADGRADGAIAYFHHTFMSQIEDGCVTRAVVILGVTPGERLMVATRLREQVHSAADLKGMKIITGGPNSGKTTATTWAFLHAGLSGRDYVSLPLVPREVAVKKLADGAADAIMAHEPDASFYESTGAAYEFLDFATPAGTTKALGTIYPSTALYMPTAFIDSHPKEVRKLVSALLRSLTFIETHDADTIVAKLPPKTGGADRRSFIRQIAADKQMFGGNGRMDPVAAAGELRAMSALNAAYARVRLADTWSNDFLPRSGVR
jgi:NitT/TauT family transport system substrate-binding protein